MSAPRPSGPSPKMEMIGESAPPALDLRLAGVIRDAQFWVITSPVRMEQRGTILADLVSRAVPSKSKSRKKPNKATQNAHSLIHYAHLECAPQRPVDIEIPLEAVATMTEPEDAAAMASASPDDVLRWSKRAPRALEEMIAAVQTTILLAAEVRLIPIATANYERIIFVKCSENEKEVFGFLTYQNFEAVAFADRNIEAAQSFAFGVGSTQQWYTPVPCLIQKKLLRFQKNYRPMLHFASRADLFYSIPFQNMLRHEVGRDEFNWMGGRLKKLGSGANGTVVLVEWLGDRTPRRLDPSDTGALIAHHHSHIPLNEAVHLQVALKVSSNQRKEDGTIYVAGASSTLYLIGEIEFGIKLTYAPNVTVELEHPIIVLSKTAPGTTFDLSSAHLTPCYAWLIYGMYYGLVMQLIPGQMTRIIKEEAANQPFRMPSWWPFGSKETRPGVDGLDVIQLFIDIAHGLAFIHANGLVHRDIKMDNVLVKNGRAMITDYGFLTPMNKPTRVMGSPAAMPSFLKMLHEAKKVYTYPNGYCDVYGLGFIMTQVQREFGRYGLPKWWGDDLKLVHRMCLESENLTALQVFDALTSIKRSMQMGGR